MPLRQLPVVMMHQSGHLGAYNTRALELMGIDADTQDPPVESSRERLMARPLAESTRECPLLDILQNDPQFFQEDSRLYKAGEYSYVSNGFTTVQEGKTDHLPRLLSKIAASEGFDVDIISFPDYVALKDNPILQSDWCRQTIKIVYVSEGSNSPSTASAGKTAWFTEPTSNHPPASRKATPDIPPSKRKKPSS